MTFSFPNMRFGIERKPKEIAMHKQLLCPKCMKKAKLIEQKPRDKGFRKKNIVSFGVEDKLICTSSKCNKNWTVLQQYVFFANNKKERRMHPKKVLTNLEIIGVKMLDPSWLN